MYSSDCMYGIMCTAVYCVFAIQDHGPCDLTSWNPYADPKFVFYDHSMIAKCQSQDPVSECVKGGWVRS